MSLFSDLESIPDVPGIYLMKDENETVIYVGKAKSLKQRAKQHFAITEDSKELQLQTLTKRVDWFVTRTEAEAILLEKRMIQQLSPKLNVKLKDDKSSLLIRVTMEERYPQLLIVRDTDSKMKKSLYFGPYPSATALRKTVKLVLRLFPICNCGKNVERMRERKTTVRCMRARIGRCLAPCMNDISVGQYKKHVRNAISFLQGDVADLFDSLEKEMWEAAEEENFEKASEVRNLIATIQSSLFFQKDTRSEVCDVDILAFEEDENIIVFCKLEFRSHRINHLQIYTHTKEELSPTTMREIFSLIYGIERPKTKLLLSKNMVEQFVNDEKIDFSAPTDEKSEDLVEIARKNAKTELLKYMRDEKYKEDSVKTLMEMQELLRLPKKPEIIHGIDVSTLMGRLSVGSCVTFVNGIPEKKFYRRFRIKHPHSKSNDYAMMKEVITRKYRSPQLESDPAPDLIVIDGGKGQLNVARKVMEDYDLPFPVVSIAKKHEEIFVEWANDPIILPKTSSMLKLIQKVRDESHRFAISYHRYLRKTTMQESIFESIKGIGKQKTRILFTNYKNVVEIAEAKIEDVAKILGTNERIAEKVVELAKKLKKTDY